MKKLNLVLITMLFVVCGSLFSETSDSSQQRGAYPFIDQYVIHDSNNNEFKLFMKQEDVINMLGQPDKVTYSTEFPPEKDEYNEIEMIYNSGIRFVCRKGFPEILIIQITTPDFWISNDKLTIENATEDFLFLTYGNHFFRYYVQEKEYYYWYSTHDINILGEEAFELEYAFDFFIFFDKITDKCTTFALVADSGI